MISVRLIGEPSEVAQAARIIGNALRVVSQSDRYPCRGASTRARVYLDAEVKPQAPGAGVSDLEIYHERVKELRGQGLDSVTARLQAMDEARQRIDEREQAWHDAQEVSR
ncbi:hypothetical protein AB0O28_31795 [Microbispora sp. NPDC088329]|uniref:hypothetical protein n=1 Tax=Microbispora sp. NPDC088329 TaxID=3154869 RepID=UPI003421B8EE